MSGLTGRRTGLYLVLGTIVLLLPPCAAGKIPAAERPPTEPLSEAHAPTQGPLDLGGCLKLALDGSPRMRAARERLRVAETTKQGLDSIHPPPLVGPPDLDVRRRQADLGLTGARANLAQREQEVTYVVMRLYYSVQYARDQVRIAEELLEALKRLERDARERAARGPVAGPGDAELDLINLYVSSGEARRVNSRRAAELATAALREAMGLDPHCTLVVAEERLPDLKADLCRREVLELALARRPELIQAGVAVEVFHLEIEAQGRHCLPGTVRTFAASVDLHAREISPAVMDGEYRPGGIPFEMPTTLGGSRATRVQLAQGYAGKAEAVADKVRGLVALDAEDVYLKWESAARRVELFRGAEAVGARVTARTTEKGAGKVAIPIPGSKEKVEIDVVAIPLVGGIALQTKLIQTLLVNNARSDYAEALFNQVVALADLERVTAGGLREVLARKVCPVR